GEPGYDEGARDQRPGVVANGPDGDGVPLEIHADLPDLTPHRAADPRRGLAVVEGPARGQAPPHRATVMTWGRRGDGSRGGSSRRLTDGVAPFGHRLASRDDLRGGMPLAV